MQKGKSFVEKLAEFIVDKRAIILLLYAAAFAFSLVSQNWVSVCNDLTEYLPKETQTRKGLTIMDNEFVTLATSRVMVANITYDEAEKLSEKIKDLDVVEMVDFDDSQDHYKSANF